jgi:hypothetical protein
MLHTNLDVKENIMKMKIFLDEAEKRVGGRSALVLRLGISSQQITNARAERAGLPIPACIALAEIIGAEPLVIITESELVTEKNEDRRSILKKYAGGVMGLIAGLVLSVSLIMTPTPAQATPMLKTDSAMLYIMLNRLLRLARLKQAALRFISDITRFRFPVFQVG